MIAGNEKELINCQIQSIDRLADEILEVNLKLDRDKFEYKPGQYINLVLSDGNYRSFSIASGACRSGSIDLHIREIAASQFIRELLDTREKPGSLALEGPFGDLYYRGAPASSGSTILLLASGTGFSSIKAILEELKELNCTHQICLYWGGRCRDDLYLTTWVEHVVKIMPNLSFIPVLSSPVVEDQWSGRIGNVHQIAIDDFPDMKNCHVYACGSPVVIESARNDFHQQCGLPLSQFFA